MLKKMATGSLRLLVLGARYAIDGPPLPEPAGFLEGEGYGASVEGDGALVFRPAEPNGRGLLVVHGALTTTLAYAKTAADFSALAVPALFLHGDRDGLLTP